MLDWKVTEESNTPLPDESIEYENARRPMPRQWLFLLVAATVVAVTTIGGFLWGRLREGERLLEQDLLVQIRAEETARRFGQTSRITVLIPDNVSQRWRERYASHFRIPIGEAEAVEVVIEKLELEGELATVWVRMDEQVQRRAYRMTAGGWRRVPLDTGWAGNKTSRDVLLPQGTITVNYFEVDREFAMELIADLPALLETIEQWRSNPITLHSISIQPQELEPGVIEVYFQGDAWVTLNSPEVVQLPAHWNLSGPAAVRYALAERLLTSTPILLAEPEPLPGTTRFLEAIDHVIALQWALSPDSYANLVTEWQSHAPESTWRSPFFAIEVPVTTIDPFVETQESATALLVADVFVTQANTTNGARMLNSLDNVADWDTFFETTTGLTTRQMEEMAGAPPTTNLTLPLKVAPFPMEQRNSSSGMFAVRPPESRQPIAIEGLENATFTLPDGTEWEAECASLFGELEIDGAWREEGLRLTASNITIPHVTYPARFLSTPSPPADTIAYLGSGSETVMPNGDGMNSIVALTSTGERVPVLMNGSPDPQPFAVISSQWIYSNADEGILIQLSGVSTRCYGDWLLRFVPGVGITGAWLYRTEGANTTIPIQLWDDTSGRGILIFQNLTGEREMPFWWLEEGDPKILGEPDGMLPFGEISALRPGATHIAVHHQSTPNQEQPTLSLIDLSGATDPVRYSPHDPNSYLAGTTFSPDGQYLYLGWTDSRIVENSGDGTQVWRIDIQNGSSMEMWQPNDGILYALFRDKTDSPLYAVAVANAPETRFRLVKFDENEIVPVAENRQGSEISYIQTCGTGGAYYLTLEYEGDRPNFEDDTRTLHIIPPDATGINQDIAYPLRAWEFAALCP